MKQRETTQHIHVKTTETTFLQLGAFFSVVFFFFSLLIAPFDVVVMTCTLYNIEGKLLKEH